MSFAYGEREIGGVQPNKPTRPNQAFSVKVGDRIIIHHKEEHNDCEGTVVAVMPDSFDLEMKLWLTKGELIVWHNLKTDCGMEPYSTGWNKYNWIEKKGE